MKAPPFHAVAAAAWLALAAHAAWGLPPEGFVLCPFRLLTGHACPGCGMGRALLHALRGDWAASWDMHPLGLPLLALWTAWLARGALNRARGRAFSSGGEAVFSRPAFSWAALALVLGVYAARL